MEAAAAPVAAASSGGALSKEERSRAREMQDKRLLACVVTLHGADDGAQSNSACAV